MHDTFILQKILINLLKGIVYQEQNPPLWNSLIVQQSAVIEYFKMLGLELFLDEVEGYAFLCQTNSDNSDVESNGFTEELPQLIVRRQLSYSTSLLCVLLRKKMLEQDTSGGDLRVVIPKEQIISMMTLYLGNKNNETKAKEQIETCINKLVDLGFLRKLKNNDDSYEVRRIIKAFVDGAWLGELDTKLNEYKEYANHAK